MVADNEKKKPDPAKDDVDSYGAKGSDTSHLIRQTEVSAALTRASMKFDRERTKPATLDPQQQAAADAALAKAVAQSSLERPVTEAVRSHAAEAIRRAKRPGGGDRGRQ